uniref:Uncharacterized protein n=1 Tax=Octopus bimaculoides TaxID=37653 RepID=A0A0L8GKW5_OCTBM
MIDSEACLIADEYHKSYRGSKILNGCASQRKYVIFTHPSLYKMRVMCVVGREPGELIPVINTRLKAEFQLDLKVQNNILPILYGYTYKFQCNNITLTYSKI